MCPGILIISEAKISWVEAKMLRIEAKIHIVDIRHVHLQIGIGIGIENWKINFLMELLVSY